MPSRESMQARELRDMEGSDDDNHPSQAGPSKRKRRNNESMDDVFGEMNPEEKARLNRAYRQLQTSAEDMKANMANTTIAQLNANLIEGGKLFKTVRDAGTAYVDARLLNTTADTAVSLARQMNLESSSFDNDEYLSRVKRLLGLERDEEEDESGDESGDEHRRQRAPVGRLGDWSKLGWMAAKYYRRVPGVEFMYGPIECVTKKRTMARRQRAQVEPEIRPEEIQTQAGSKAKKDDMLTNVRLIDKVLQKIDPKGEGFNFFRLVIHPQSFGQSVENMFYVSFLVRDGKAGLRVRKNGEVMIYARQPHDGDLDGELVKHQAIMELTEETWKEAIRLFKIQAPTIPSRAYETAPPLAANGWYQ